MIFVRLTCVNVVVWRLSSFNEKNGGQAYISTAAAWACSLPAWCPHCGTLWFSARFSKSNKPLWTALNVPAALWMFRAESVEQIKHHTNICGAHPDPQTSPTGQLQLIQGLSAPPSPLWYRTPHKLCCMKETMDTMETVWRKSERISQRISLNKHNNTETVK